MISQRILLDANLMVLLVVGTASPDYIADHKRLTEYSIEDYWLLIDLLVKFGDLPLMTTPHVLTEASNLLNAGWEPRRTHIMESFGIFLSAVTEIHVPAASAVVRPEFNLLGLSDAALLELDADDAILLTADGPLYNAACRAGRRAENFKHHRENRR